MRLTKEHVVYATTRQFARLCGYKSSGSGCQILDHDTSFPHLQHLAHLCFGGSLDEASKALEARRSRLREKSKAVVDRAIEAKLKSEIKQFLEQQGEDVCPGQQQSSELEPNKDGVLIASVT